MTEARLKEMAVEARIAFPALILKARKALNVPMQPWARLVPAVVDAANLIGDDEAENAIAAVL